MNERKHRSAIAIILADARLYRNGSPQWDEGRLRRPCQTARQACAERRKAIYRVRRFGKENKAALALADKLDSCAPGERCMNGACPVCGRALLRWAVEAKHEFLARYNDGYTESSTSIALIHCAGAAAPGRLTVETFLALNAYTRTALTSAGIDAAVFGVDLSLNEDLDGTFAPHWSIHHHGHVPGEIGTTAETRLRKLYPRCACNGISRPVLITELDGNLAGLAYPNEQRVSRRPKLLADQAHCGRWHPNVPQHARQAAHRRAIRRGCAVPASRRAPRSAAPARRQARATTRRLGRDQTQGAKCVNCNAKGSRKNSPE
jgi:hypothetical protein